MSDEKPKTIRLGGLWKKTLPNGAVVLSGAIRSPADPESDTEFRITIYKNDRKTSENSPDYNVTFNPAFQGKQSEKPQVEEKQKPAATKATVTSSAPAKAAPKAAVVEDQDEADMPF